MTSSNQSGNSALNVSGTAGALDPTSVKSVFLPALLAASTNTNFVRTKCELSPEQTVACKASVLQTFKKRPTVLQLDCGPAGCFVYTRKSALDLFAGAAGTLKVPNFRVDAGVLRPSGQHEWLKHDHSSAVSAADVRASWKDALRIVPEHTDSTGREVGFRSPQVGALHALAAHWTLKENEALVVMPTGTGKTEVMLAHMVMTTPERLLVLVPSDALRGQTFGKFVGLGVLHSRALVTPGAQRPVAGILKKAPQTAADLAGLENCNVIVSTVAMLDGVPDSTLNAFAALFDSVYFDEAHHMRATSWERVYKAMAGKRIVAFTATPYREDGLRIPLKIVYNYPLRLAQENKYFRKIDFLEVNEIDQDEADQQIAEKAVARLREDETRGHRHIILARAETKARAQKLFDSIYSVKYPELHPVVIYTNIRDKEKVLEAIKSRKHRIVVCVNMFGEGFDLPDLKIAAMHDIHQSLAITLQFTGRFTRTSSTLGDATLVANVAEPKVSDAIEELYSEDPDWNLIIPKLSAKAVQSQIDFANFLEGMGPGAGDGQRLFDLNIIRPKSSTVVYRCPDFEWKHYLKAAKKPNVQIHWHWPSKDGEMLIFVTRTRLRIDWASIKETTDEIWDVFILSYDRKRKLLFIHSSQKSSLHSELAKAVGGPKAAIIDGEQIFKVLHGISRLILYNVGLYGRGKLRFRMLTGLDIAEAIGPAAQTGSTKSNIFGAGFDAGRKVSIGASAKGRIWARASSSVPEWVNWCAEVATKLLDPTLRTDAILKHTLIPVPLKSLPSTDILTVLLPDEWIDASASYGKIAIAGKGYEISSTSVRDVRVAGGKLDFKMDVSGDHTLEFRMAWGPDETQFSVTQVTGPTATIRVENRSEELTAFFRENQPIVLLLDGSEIRGGRHLKPSDTQPYTFSLDNIVPIDWTGVPLDTESKWRHGIQRPVSIQGKMIDDLVKEDNCIVFDDDDSGETADIVVIREHAGSVFFRLYHCKYSSGKAPAERTKDLYEVCGQAVRSSRLTHNAEAFLRQLEAREKRALGGRLTRFEKGDSKVLTSLRRRIRKLRAHYEFYIVQPGLSKAALEPENATILGAADTYLRETAGTALRVIASA